jgi:putative addiction module killer protein
MINPFEVIFYTTHDNHCPISEWLSFLEIKTRSRILKDLTKLAVGNLQSTKSLGSGLFEVKCQHGAGYRICFAQYGNKLILLLNAGEKKSQGKDIERARKYKQDYEKDVTDEKES